MADIFNEIDEELRGDQMRKIWERYSGLFLIVALLIVVGVAGWRGWEYWREQVARSDGDKYQAALQLSLKGDYSGAEAALKALSQNGSAGYALLARFRAAGELGLANDAAGSLAAFDAISRDSSVAASYRSLAAIRAAYLALDLEDRAGIEKRVQPLLGPGDPWRHQARVILATSDLKAGDVEAAKKIIGDLEADAETPSELSNQVSMLSSVIAATAKANAVNPPEPPPAPVSEPAAPSTVTDPIQRLDPTMPAPMAWPDVPSTLPATPPPAKAE